MWLKHSEGRVGELQQWVADRGYVYAVVKFSDGSFDSWTLGIVTEVPAPQTSEDEVSHNNAMDAITHGSNCSSLDTACENCKSDYRAWVIARGQQQANV